jgi:hypothetical protein
MSANLNGYIQIPTLLSVKIMNGSCGIFNDATVVWSMNKIRGYFLDLIIVDFFPNRVNEKPPTYERKFNKTINFIQR